MIPFLGIDIATDKNNVECNGKEFLVATPSLMASRTLAHSTERAGEVIQRSKLPLVLRLMQWGGGIIGAFLAIVIVKALDDLTIAEAYQKAPWMFWLSGASLLVCLVLFLIGIIQARHVLKQDESTQIFSEFEENVETVFEELGVPADAREVDILSFFYKEKDGEIKVVAKGLSVAMYINSVFRVHADATHLYLSDVDGRFALPLAEMVAIHTVKKRITLMHWNKEQEHKAEPYKPYKLTCDDNGMVHCKYYHILEFSHEGTAWGVYIPCYELPVFESLTGLKAQEI